MGDRKTNFQEEIAHLPLVDEDAVEVSEGSEDSSPSRVNNTSESTPSSGIVSPMTGPECKYIVVQVVIVVVVIVDVFVLSLLVCLYLLFYLFYLH